jgi:SNF2 family DNA or RNA helicase
MEFGWNPKDHIQAEDRAHRIGQRGQLTVWNLVADNTVDGDILDLIQKKRVIVDAIADGKLSPEAEQSLNIYGDLMRRLSDARMDITNV